MTELFKSPVLTQPPFLVVHDEFWNYARPNEDLLTTLRATPGVPDAHYFVKDGQVFVWSRLLRLVRQAHPTGPVSHEQVAAHLADAWVSPLQAVSEEGVVPRPFELKQAAQGHWRIWHQGLSAFLPGTYDSKQAAHPDLARLLLGHPAAGAGNVTFGAQELVSDIAYDGRNLPPCPVLEFPAPAHDSPRGSFRSLGYLPGYSALSAQVYEALQVRDEQWETQVYYAGALREARQADAWGLAVPLLQDRMTVLPEAAVEDWCRDEVAQLRKCYPELAWIPGMQLYDVFGQYCEARGMRYFAARETEFLAFLIGRLAYTCEASSGPASSYEGGTAAMQGRSEVDARLCGVIALACLLQGRALGDALEAGRQSVCYQAALAVPVWAARKVMWFLEELGGQRTLPGLPKRTMVEHMQSWRSQVCSPVHVTQRLSDFDEDRA